MSRVWESLVGRATGSGKFCVIWIIVWPLIGAAIGYHAAERRGCSRVSGVVSGAFWGCFAPLLYFYDWPYFAD